MGEARAQPGGTGVNRGVGAVAGKGKGPGLRWMTGRGDVGEASAQHGGTGVNRGVREGGEGGKGEGPGVKDKERCCGEARAQPGGAGVDRGVGADGGKGEGGWCGITGGGWQVSCPAVQVQFSAIPSTCVFSPLFECYVAYSQGVTAADLNGDGDLELVFGTGSGHVYAIKGSDGLDIRNFPFRTHGRFV